MENTRKKLLKAYLALQTVTGLFLNCVFFQFISKKILLILECFAIAHAIEILLSENVEKSSFNVTLMRDHLLVCLQLQKISPFPKTNKRVCRCRSVSLFFDVYCICRETYFHDDLKSDDGYFMANCKSCGEWYHKKCMNNPVKVFRDEKYHMQWKCCACRK